MPYARNALMRGLARQNPDSPGGPVPEEPETPPAGEPPLGDDPGDGLGEPLGDLGPVPPRRPGPPPPPEPEVPDSNTPLSIPGTFVRPGGVGSRDFRSSAAAGGPQGPARFGVGSPIAPGLAASMSPSGGDGTSMGGQDDDLLRALAATGRLRR